MGNWEDYLIPKTEVLKNKLGITSSDELKKAENVVVVSKLAELYLKKSPEIFDSAYLCELHKYLFEDIYDFAGQYRTVDIFKQTGFEHYENIAQELDKFIKLMNLKNVNVNSRFEFAQYLADYYYGLISIHPFREGNGRTCREFIRQLSKVLSAGVSEIDYTKVDSKNFMIGVLDRNLYPSLLAYEIYKSFSEPEVRDTKNLNDK